MNRKMWTTLGIALVAWVLLLAAVLAGPLARSQPRANPDSQAALGTGFTYQGRLDDSSGPVTGNCDMAFRLYDAGTGGSQVGGAISATVPITDGLFTVVLNAGGEFGPTAFAGDARWLGIRVKCPPDVSFTDLGRQELTATPYALYAQSAPWGGLTGVPGSFADNNDGVEYQNVIVVAKSGGDFTSIQAALDSITDNGPNNRYLVWVAPGTYTETVTMEEYVDIAGAGELVTKITHTGSADWDTGTVVGADNAELRFLTVENTGGNTYAIAIYNDFSSPRLTHVTATASGSTYNQGVFNRNNASPTMADVTASASGGTYNSGVRNYNTSPTMTGVTASASGGTGTYNYGVYNYESSLTMMGVTASASGGTSSYGVYNSSSSPTIQNSVLSASGSANNYGIFNHAVADTFAAKVSNCQVTGGSNTIRNDDNFITLVGASQLSGGPVYYGGGTITCAGVYDEGFAFYANTCP